MSTTINWDARIRRQVSRWWRRQGYRYVDRPLCEDLQQAVWVAVLEERIHEERWQADMHAVLRDAISLALRGVPRGTTSVPWPWASAEVTPLLRERVMSVEERVRLRIAIHRTWAQLDVRERLVWYGLTSVPGPPGPGSAGIPQAWAQQWGLTRIMVHSRRRAIQRRLRSVLA